MITSRWALCQDSHDKIVGLYVLQATACERAFEKRQEWRAAKELEDYDVMLTDEVWKEGAIVFSARSKPRTVAWYLSGPSRAYIVREIEWEE